MRFADHAYRHLSNDGILTPAAATVLLQGRADQIDRAIVGESARWGDAKRSPAYTRDTWLTAVNNVRTSCKPGPASCSDSFGTRAGTPASTPPTLRINGVGQHGGTIDLGDSLTSIRRRPARSTTRSTAPIPRPRGGGVPDRADLYTRRHSARTRAVYVKARRLQRRQWSAPVRSRLLRRSRAGHPHHRADVQPRRSVAAPRSPPASSTTTISSTSRSRTSVRRRRCRWPACG